MPIPLSVVPTYRIYYVAEPMPGMHVIYRKAPRPS